jgi:hypothetical protein
VAIAGLLASGLAPLHSFVVVARNTLLLCGMALGATVLLPSSFFAVGAGLYVVLDRPLRA